MNRTPELTILSYGAGQDSWTILLKYVHDPSFRVRYGIGRFLVVMSDTGNEHDRTYLHVEHTKKFCQLHGIEFVHITADMGYHYAQWQSLQGFFRAVDGIGSKSYPKSCTDKLKLQPIYKFVEHWLSCNYHVPCDRKQGFKTFAARHGKIQMIIGIADGEQKRVKNTADKLKWRAQSLQTIYPLIDMKMDRGACQEYIKSVGAPLPPPSNCKLCPFLSEIELLWLYRFHRSDYDEWVQLEKNKLYKCRELGEKNYGVWGKKRLPEVLAETIEKYGHWSDDRLDEYKMSHGHCVMSKY